MQFILCAAVRVVGMAAVLRLVFLISKLFRHLTV